MNTKRFHLGDILTVTTGIYCTPNGMDAIYELCGWMTGDTPMTHQLPRFADECAPEIHRQHPNLAEIVVPKFAGPAAGMAWLGRMVEQYGEFRDIGPLPVADHTRIDPLAEVAMNYPNVQVIDLGGEPCNP